jgi:hypothetical protein
LAEFATNNYQSESTRVTPFYANNGCHLHMNCDLTERQVIVENLDAQEYATKLHVIDSLITAKNDFTQAKQ